MAKEYRNTVNPITPRDWFLYYLFTDENFAAIRKRWRAEINDIESGEPGRSGLPFLKQEKITDQYVAVLCERFDINKETAVDGLRYTKWNRTLNKNRVPTAEIDGDRITINVGPGTKFEDIENLWNIRITSLQKKLPGYVSQREVPASEPLIAYLVHKELLKGRKLTEIHQDYQMGTLDSRLPSRNRWADVNEFRRYYNVTVKGLIRMP